MSSPVETVATIRVQAAIERMRQERETFDQWKRHENLWFWLRLTTGYVSILSLVLILVVCTFVLIRHADFPAGAVVTATGALLVDALGLIASIMKVVMNPESMRRLQPVTAPRSRSSSDRMPDVATDA